MSKTGVKQKLVDFKDKTCAFFVKLGGKLKAFFGKVGEKIGFKKNKWKLLIYGCSTVATVVTFSVLLSWAARGNAVAEIVVKQVSALITEGARVEYLVGETPSADGFALEINGKLQEKCTVDVDTSTAGVKAARVHYEKGNTTYEGYYPVTVFGVKHLDVRQMPTAITETADGSVILQDLVVWAELSGSPTQLTLQDAHPEWTTTVVLSPENYSVRIVEDAVSVGRVASMRCGNSSLEFVFVTLDNESFVLNSTSRVLSFTNADDEGSETLSLVVTQTESDKSDGNKGATGKYVYTDASGATRILDFSYYMSDDYGSHFGSTGVTEELIDSTEENKKDLRVTIDGHEFIASNAQWTGAVLTL